MRSEIISMPGKYKFQDLWLEDEEWKKWLRRGNDKYSAFCCFCKKTFDISHSGVNCVKAHAKGKKHSSFEENLKSGKQMKMHAFTCAPLAQGSNRPSPWKSCFRFISSANNLNLSLSHI